MATRMGSKRAMTVLRQALRPGRIVGKNRRILDVIRFFFFFFRSLAAFRYDYFGPVELALGFSPFLCFFSCGLLRAM